MIHYGAVTPGELSQTHFNVARNAFSFLESDLHVEIWGYDLALGVACRLVSYPLLDPEVPPSQNKNAKKLGKP